jgi:hypothetical protein
MTNFKWTIPQLDRMTADNWVATAHYNVTATDGEYSVSTYGTIGFTQDLDSSGYTPYEKLTQEMVVGWVQSSLGKDTVEASLQSQSDLQKNPVTAAGTPWVA